jgi:hypothetical protein
LSFGSLIYDIAWPAVTVGGKKPRREWMFSFGFEDEFCGAARRTLWLCEG